MNFPTTPQERADRARVGLAAYLEVYNDPDDEIPTAIQDFISDLLHLWSTYPEDERWGDVEDLLRRAVNNYEEEQEEESA